MVADGPDANGSSAAMGDSAPSDGPSADGVPTDGDGGFPDPLGLGVESLLSLANQALNAGAEAEGTELVASAARMLEGAGQADHGSPRARAISGLVFRAVSLLGALLTTIGTDGFIPSPPLLSSTCVLVTGLTRLLHLADDIDDGSRGSGSKGGGEDHMALEAVTPIGWGGVSAARLFSYLLPLLARAAQAARVPASPSSTSGGVGNVSLVCSMLDTLPIAALSDLCRAFDGLWDSPMGGSNHGNNKRQPSTSPSSLLSALLTVALNGLESSDTEASARSLASLVSKLPTTAANGSDGWDLNEFLRMLLAEAPEGVPGGSVSDGAGCLVASTIKRELAEGQVHKDVDSL